MRNKMPDLFNNGLFKAISINILILAFEARPVHAQFTVDEIMGSGSSSSSNSYNPPLYSSAATTGNKFVVLKEFIVTREGVFFHKGDVVKKDPLFRSSCCFSITSSFSEEYLFKCTLPKDAVLQNTSPMALSSTTAEASTVANLITNDAICGGKKRKISVQMTCAYGLLSNTIPFFKDFGQDTNQDSFMNEESMNYQFHKYLQMYSKKQNQTDSAKTSNSTNKNASTTLPQPTTNKSGTKTRSAR